MLFNAFAFKSKWLRLAVHNSTYMTNQLGIKSSVHRQKLRLNALDVVLFGHRDPSTKTKDIALALLVSRPSRLFEISFDRTRFSCFC